MKPGDLIATTFPNPDNMPRKPHGIILKKLGKMRQNGTESMIIHYLVMTREGRIIDFRGCDIEVLINLESSQ
ncbi:MAG TPA: hypothetical protein EYQ00_11015 [Dehalococcoidia bacterium]|nr:hypothetical protein [Dehalococcoidia bacterium]